jgi:hypothetical protein
MKLVLINVGISGGHRGIIFPDRSFVFVPLDNRKWVCKLMPRFEDLKISDYTYTMFQDGFGELTIADLLPSLHGKQAHNDPDFVNRTYGHAKRGFGYERLIRSLSKGDALLFYATLDFKGIDGEKRDRTINPNWGTYIVGAFNFDIVYGNDEFDDLPREKQLRFKNNPHYYCRVGAHLWVAGKKNGYGLFRKAVPLSSPESSTTCLPILSRNFVSVSGKPAGSAGWYRAAFECKRNSEKILGTITQQGQVPIHKTVS